MLRGLRTSRSVALSLLLLVIEGGDFVIHVGGNAAVRLGRRCALDFPAWLKIRLPLLAEIFALIG